MAIEHFFVRHLESRTVFFRFYSATLDQRFDFDDNTWKSSPTDEKLAATEKPNMGDEDESGYVASVELRTLWSEQTPLELVVQALDDLDVDVVLDERRLVISEGGEVSAPPAAAATTLAAVNELLRAIKQFPVDELDTGGVSPAAEAERILNIHDYRIQSDGWYENTELVELEPDEETDKIAISAQILRTDTRDSSGDMNVSTRDGYLYNLDDLTDEFSGTVYAKIVRRLAFSDLTLLVQAYIIASAKVEFQMYLVGNSAIDELLRNEYWLAQTRARKFDQENADVVFTGGHINQILGLPYTIHHGR